MYQWDKSTATTDCRGSFVTTLKVNDSDTIVLESIFCLKNLEQLTIENTIFENDDYSSYNLMNYR